MKYTITILAALALTANSALAIITQSFDGTDKFLKRAQNIVIAKCFRIPKHQEAYHDRLHPVSVEIVKVLKGTKMLGKQTAATTYPMEPGVMYMLTCSGGGLAFDTDLLFVGELTVVRLPSQFDVAELDGKELKEQVQYLLSCQLSELQGQLAPLLAEKALLEEAISDSHYQRFLSEEPMKIGRIVQTTAKTDPHRPNTVILDFEGKKMKWSLSEAGKSGFLYFEKISPLRTAYWEFAPCDAAKVEDLAGKPLETKFYGMYSPGRDEVGWSSGLEIIHLLSGKVLLARTTDDLRKIFIIQIIQDQEQMTARYTTIQGR